MTNVGILTPCITGGDAVSNDVVGMGHVLTAEGYNVRIFADDIFVQPAINITKADDIWQFLKHSSDLVIYHHSVGWDKGLDVLAKIGCKKVIKYHNVTPPKYFESVSLDYAFVCRRGRQQLAELAELPCDLYLSDSEYNMYELILMGAPSDKCFVVPPFHHIERLEKLHANLEVIDQFRGDCVNVLMVGRLAPNKGYHQLIRAFSIYHHIYNSRSRLILVGRHDRKLQKYIESICELVDELELHDSVVFAKEVSDKKLKAYYLIANIFMITSEHEGFCVPLVEAMAMGIPIIAYGSSAIPDTAGKSGFVWLDHDPTLFAGTIDYLTKNPEAKAILGGWTEQRYQEYFTNSRIQDSLLESLRVML
jgi:glycosyltransferase involved in cell wall biosynthesis